MYRDLNDIIPPSRRRTIDARPGETSPGGRTMDIRPASPEPSLESAAGEMPPMPPRRTPSRGGKRFPLATALIAFVVVLACGGILYAFAGAKVVIVPVTNAATITSDFTATLATGDLPFQMVTVDKTASASVPAEGTVTAADPASGKVTVTNSQTTPQALIKNTRFSTPDGLIFRIHDSIAVPAGGHVAVTVYADEAGEKYNVGPTSFTVPGLAGTPAFTQVTAKSDASMAGGFAGTRPSVAQATKDRQYASMQTTLATDLTKALAAKTPQGYVLVPGASFTDFTPQNDAAGASGTVALSEKGTMTAVLFPADALGRAIAFKAVGTYGGQPVTLKDVSGLKVTPAEPTLAPDATQFVFNLAGTTTIVWTVDESKIAGAVAGKTRESSKIAIDSLPEVDKATLILRPFWASRYPADPAKIKVVVTSK